MCTGIGKYALVCSVHERCYAVARWQTCLRSRILAVGIDSAWNDNNEYELWDEEAVCKGRVRAPGRKPSYRGASSIWQLA